MNWKENLKWVSLLLALVMVLSVGLIACDDDDDEDDASDTPLVSQQPTEESVIEPTAEPAQTPVTAVTVDSTLGEIMEAPGGEALLRECMGDENVDNPQMSMALGMTLAAIAPMSGGMITDETIACVEAGLAALAGGEATEPAAALEPDGSTLNMYAAYGGLDLVAEKFEEATGIKVEYISASSGEVLARLQAEKNNPGADIWFGGGVDAFIDAADEGLLEAYLSPNVENVGAAYRDTEGYWTGLSLVIVGFLVNNDRLEDKGLAMPASWADLADPSYEDELMASDLNTSGTAYTTVSGILQVLGADTEEDAWEFLDQMYENIPYLEKSGSAPAKLALQGEYAIGIVPDPHNSIINNPDAPLTPVFPSDGVLAWPSPVSIIANADHPNNARIFVDWCLSDEGQTVLMEASPRLPTTDVETIEGIPQPSDLNMVAYDLLYWGAERDRVVDTFNDRYPQYQ